MRPKEEKIVVTFHTTDEALKFEKLAGEAKIDGRLIPTPVIISAGCGLAFAAPVSMKTRIKEMQESTQTEYENMGNYII